MEPRRTARTSGFTLTELLIAVAIVGILAAIAYPSYRGSVVRTHRNAAKACLSEYAQFMERYYTTNLTYVGAAPSLGCRVESNLNQRYTFSVDSLTQSTYRVLATPTGAQAASDTRCGALGLDQAGVRSAGDVAHCW